MKLSPVLAIAFSLVACATHEEQLSQSEQHADVVTPGGPSPESDECGYRRTPRTLDGVEVYGPPVLYQNNCQDGLVCGDPTLGDTCTPVDSELITCGCVKASGVCDPAKLAADMDSSIFSIREAATVRATQCCQEASTSPEDRAKFLAALRGTSPSAELDGRVNTVAAGCPAASCVAQLEWVAPFNPELTEVGWTLQCLVKENHCLGYEPTAQKHGGGDFPGAEPAYCTCTCAPYRGPLPVTEK